jgi:hypothetical protein
MIFKKIKRGINILVLYIGNEDMLNFKRNLLKENR